MKKRVLSITLAVVMGICMTACTSAVENETGNNQEETVEKQSGSTSNQDCKILFTSYDQSLFPGIQIEGVNEVSEELGIDVTVQSPAVYPDLAAQIEIIETGIADGADAVIIHPVDSEGICETVQKAADAGTAVFIVDTQIADTTGTVGFYGSDNYHMGAMAAKELAEALGGKGEVAVLAGNEASLAHSMRRDGFMETMEKEYPDVEVVDVQYDNADALTANQMASAFILSYPDLDGMFFTGEDGLSGILSAVSENNKSSEYQIAGIASGGTTNEAVENGSIVGAVMQNPHAMGYMSVKAAYEYVTQGIEPEEYINDTGAVFVTQDNMDTEEAQEVMFE